MKPLGVAVQHLTNPSIARTMSQRVSCRSQLDSNPEVSGKAGAVHTECDAVQKKWPTIWILETTDAFAVPSRGLFGDSCANGSIPLYRLYNNRADANHRFTTSKLVRDQMIALGWVLEGSGLTTDTVKAMCVPQ
jgi:hypothetical protein